MTRTRRVILVIVLLFVVTSIYQSPEQSGHGVRAVFGLLAGFAQALTSFFGAIVQ